MMMNTLKTTLGALALATAMVAGAAQASTVNVSGTVAVPGKINNYITELNAALGGAAVLLTPASISSTGPVKLTFTAVAAESGFNNTFRAGGTTPGSLSENSNFGEGLDLLTADFGSFSSVFNGLLDGLLSFSNNGNPVFTALLGAGNEFGVFASGGAGAHSVFFLAFDDVAPTSPRFDDDNHDDFIVRVNVAPIPLPAGGILLLTALGGAAALRRRKSV